MAKTVKEDKNFKEMPHNADAERALLGCILIDAKIQVEIAGQVKENDFYFENHQIIFHAIENIIIKNQPVDIVTVLDELEKEGSLTKAGGVEYITKLADVLPSSAHYYRYLELVLRDSTLRKLMQGSAQIIEKCGTNIEESEALEFAEKTIYDISQTADTGDMVRVDKILPDVMAKLDELAKDKSATKGIRTQFRGIDNLLNGLHKSDLIVLAARPAVGKTSLAMNIVENIAKQGYYCAVFSLEMSKEQLTQRLLCSVAGVSMENAVKGRLNKSEWLRLAKAREILAKMNLYIDESSVSTTQEILSQCRRLKRKTGLDFVVIDYLQLMSGGRRKSFDNRQQEISEISRNLKIMAKELNVPVLALSQLSRAVETRKGRPQLADLRESGSIEQDADIVIFIHRPDKGATEEEIAKGKVQKNVAEILVEKHRNGPTGFVKLYFKGECTKFINLDNNGEPEEEETGNTTSLNLQDMEKLLQESNDLKESDNNPDDELFS